MNVKDIVAHNLKERLKELRSQTNWTQADIAYMLDMTRGAYSKYEEGAANPPIAILCKLADIYGLTIDELINDKANKRTPIETAYYALPVDKRKIVDFILGL